MQSWKKEYCPSCQMELNGQQQWDEHRKSRKHRKQWATYQRELQGEVNPYILAR